ncbi:MAG: DUF444 family protein [Candidatus Parvarchaeota archaeon]|nr:DUF444 family protein [Candidatus Parvarchaeota archaeon]
MSDLGDSEEKYKKKVDEEDDDLDLSVEDLVDIVNGGAVSRHIPLKSNPRIVYGTDEDGSEGTGDQGGDSRADIVFGIDRKYILSQQNKWKLKFTKPNRFRSTQMEFLVSENGLQENEEETLEAMLDRQNQTGEFKKKGFHIDVKEEDIRYDIVRDKPIPYKKATFILMRDVSPSMDEVTKMADMVALHIILRLQEEYKENVTRCYIVHSSGAEEVSERDFFKDVYGGGTSFLDAYKTVSAMLSGTPYKSLLGYNRKISWADEDVYVMHITDGENLDPEGSVVEEIKSMLPKITRLMYMQINENRDGWPKFINEIKQIDSTKLRYTEAKKEATNVNIAKALSDLLGDTE